MGLPMHRHRPNAFTLVEILIVVVILGILAAIIVPQFSSATDDASRAAFVRDLRVYTDAAELFTAQQGRYLEDSSTGQLPAGFDRYIDADRWTRRTSIGGRWDAEYMEMGVTSAVGVHFSNAGDRRDDDFMLEIDVVIDDGDLATGAFRKLANDRFYAVIAD